MIPALVLGCILGSILAHVMPSRDLRFVFGVMAVIMGSYFFFPSLPSLKIGSRPNPLLTLLSFFIGTLSSMLGIGGGAITFPILRGCPLEV
jgi:uncharacterized membrane protein YfcA